MIENDLERIANALDRIAFVLEGQHRLPCESAAPTAAEQQALSPPLWVPQDTAEPEAPRKTAKATKPKAEAKPAEDTQDDKAPAPESAKPTLEDMRAALVDLQKIAGRDAALGVLAKYQARKVSDIQPDKYADVIADCVKALAGAPA